MTGSLERN